MSEAASVPASDDPRDLEHVAALLERAGLSLPPDQVEALATAYRKDRAAFDRMRAIVTLEDEPAHIFRTARTGDSTGEPAGGSA